MLGGIPGCDSALRKSRCCPVVYLLNLAEPEVQSTYNSINSICFHIKTAQVAQVAVTITEQVSSSGTLWRSNWVVFAFNSLLRNLNTIFNLAGKRLYPLVAYLDFCLVSGNHPESS